MLRHPRVQIAAVVACQVGSTHPGKGKLVLLVQVVHVVASTSNTQIDRIFVAVVDDALHPKT